MLLVAVVGTLEVSGLPAIGRAGAAIGHLGATWGHAELVPGLVALNTAGESEVTDISCAAARNCAAVGYLDNTANGLEPLVADETGGVWGHAIPIVGIPDEKSGREAAVLGAVSCPAPGDCSAAGWWSTGTPDDSLEHLFVVDEVDGAWQSASALQGLAPKLSDLIGAFPPALLRPLSLSCWSSGNCALGGESPTESTGGLAEGFVANELGGVWQKAAILSGLAPTKTKQESAVNSVSCSTGGYCTAGGWGNVTGEGFVATGVEGTWGRVEPLPGLTALEQKRGAPLPVVGAVTCPAPGHCSAVGEYYARGPHAEGFVAQQSGGVWGMAVAIPGLARLNKGGGVQVTALVCRADDCSAGGFYRDGTGHQRGFVVEAVQGRWRTAIEVPGVQGMGVTSIVSSLSCSSPGDCAVVGFAGTQAGAKQGIVAAEINGTWGRAEVIPGLMTLNADAYADGLTLSCSGALDCSSSGIYASARGYEVFVTTG